MFAMLAEKCGAGDGLFTLDELRTLDKSKLSGVSDYIRSLDCYANAMKTETPLIRGMYRLFGGFLRNFDKVGQVALAVPDGSSTTFFQYIQPYFELGVYREEIQQVAKLIKMEKNIKQKQGTSYNLLITHDQYEALKGDESVLTNVYHIKSTIIVDLQRQPIIYNKLLSMDVVEDKSEKKKTSRKQIVDDSEQLPIASRLFDAFKHPAIPHSSREGLMSDSFKAAVQKAIQIEQQKQMVSEDDDNGASAGRVAVPRPPRSRPQLQSSPQNQHLIINGQPPETVTHI